MSSGLNTLAGTIYEDFISPYMPPTTTEKRASNIMKAIVLVIGASCTAMVFIVEKLGGIIQLSYSLSGITSGPILGMFSLGMLCPKANAKVRIKIVTSPETRTFVIPIRVPGTELLLA